MDPQYSVIISCAEDGKVSASAVAAALFALGHFVFEPYYWNMVTHQPVYDRFGHPQFAVVILTPQYLDAYVRKAEWTKPGEPVFDTFYVLDDSTPLRLPNGPWDGNSAGAAINTLDFDKAIEELMNRLKTFLSLCDKCHNPSWNGMTFTYSKDGSIVGRTCKTCSFLEMANEFRSAGILSTQLMIYAGMESPTLKKIFGDIYPILDIKVRTAKIHSALENFELNAWFKARVKEYFNSSKSRGHKLEVSEELHILLWGAAGRVMFTFQNPKSGHMITSICSDDSDITSMGIQGVYATSQEAIDMINAATKAIQSGMRFESSEKVSYAGF